MSFLQKTIYKTQVPSSSQNCLWQEVSKLLKRIGASVIQLLTGFVLYSTRITHADVNKFKWIDNQSLHWLIAHGWLFLQKQT